MRLSFGLAALPAGLILCVAAFVAIGGLAHDRGGSMITAGADVARARETLMRVAPVGTPADVAFARLKDQGLSCAAIEPPLANLTWRIIECSTMPSPGRSVLSIDVAGRNGFVADIGVEDLSCSSRADGTNPAPDAADCDLSGDRVLALEGRRRAAGSALLTEVLGAPAREPKPRL